MFVPCLFHSLTVDIQSVLSRPGESIQCHMETMIIMLNPQSMVDDVHCTHACTRGYAEFDTIIKFDLPFPCVCLGRFHYSILL
jgi:hypothetical protein